MSSASTLFSPSPSSSSASVLMVVIGILVAFALLASNCAFVTRCQPLRSLLSRRSPLSSTSVIRGASAAAAEEQQRPGLGLSLIRMLPVVRFTSAEDAVGMAPRISVSECAVCLSEFVERERVRLLPGCSHAFHIDCIDTWLQGSARCPFCRRDVTLPAPQHRPPAAQRASRGCNDELATGGNDDGSIVIEVRGERESWAVGHGGGGGGRRLRRKVESVGDEVVDTRKMSASGEFAVQPMRRSPSMDSCDVKQRQLYVSVGREFLALRQASQ